MILRLALLLIAIAAPMRAEEVVAGLSQNYISITADFNGSEILVFGAVKREEPIPTDSPLDVVITVQGPSTPLTIRRKDRRFGIWVNTEEVRASSAPSFYAIATTRPMTKTLTATEDLRHRVSVPLAIRAVGATSNTDEPVNFIDAVIRIREANRLYQLRESTVEISEETLFSTEISLPANLTEGDYSLRIFLTRNGQVVDIHEGAIEVRKEGLERWLHRLAHEQPLAYGLLSLLLAISAGWAASEAFRLMRT